MDQIAREYVTLIVVEVETYGTLGQASSLTDRVRRQMELQFGSRLIDVRMEDVREHGS